MVIDRSLGVLDFRRNPLHIQPVITVLNQHRARNIQYPLLAAFDFLLFGGELNHAEFLTKRQEKQTLTPPTKLQFVNIFGS